MAELNEKKDAGEESFEAEMKGLGEVADVELKNKSTKSKTGVCFLTKYRCESIIEYLEARRKWKNAEEFEREKSELKTKMLALKAPGTWQYKFRLKEVDGKNVLQRPTIEFTRKVNKQKTTVERRRDRLGQRNKY